MIQNEDMKSLKKIELSLKTMDPEDDELIIFLAVGNQGWSCASTLKGNEKTVAASLATLLQIFLENRSGANKKLLKSFFISRILAF